MVLVKPGKPMWGLPAEKGGSFIPQREILRRVPEDELVDQLFVEIHKIIEERKNS